MSDFSNLSSVQTVFWSNRDTWTATTAVNCSKLYCSAYQGPRLCNADILRVTSQTDSAVRSRLAAASGQYTEYSQNSLNDRSPQIKMFQCNGRGWGGRWCEILLSHIWSVLSYFTQNVNTARCCVGVVGHGHRTMILFWALVPPELTFYQYILALHTL